MSARGLRALLVATGALAWAGPWLPAHARAALALAFASICHQRADRSLVLAGHTMSVCSRCAGIYAGLALGALFAWPHLSRPRHKVLLGAAFALLLVDVVMQDAGIHPVWHSARLLTGAACGYAAGAWLTRELAPAPAQGEIGSQG